MDLGTMLYNNLKDVTWSTTSLPLDHLVSAYRLPQIVKLDNGQLVEGLRDNDYLLVHSCRQWTTITAHSLEEGHYVIGPKIEIPVHYEGQFKLLDQDRDVKEPVQYFNSVEEVAKAFPERVYVMEEITFNVKMASGECNDDTEVYNITLCTGDELTLMGQAEILYAKTSREKSRFNTIFKKIGKLNSISKIGRGKMPCLICMNHRTNESISLPFQCKGRFSTCSPTELQMQDGEHTIRDIVEKTRLPVNVAVPGSPPRNPHDLHLIREGHRYKLVNVQTKTVVVCCVLRSNKIVPVHFPFHLAMPRFVVPEELLQGELWLDTVVHRWFSFCQEHFDIDDYSRAVRDVRADWGDDGKSSMKCSGGGGGGGGSHTSNSNGGTNHTHVPSSLSHARDELTQSFHRLSVCVYGSNLHGNSEVNLQGCMTLCVDWALLPSDSVPSDSGDSEHFFTEPAFAEAAVADRTSPPSPTPAPPQPAAPQNRSDIPYEELWLDHLRGHIMKPLHSISSNGCGPTAALPYPVVPCPSVEVTGADAPLTPPPVPPKSEAVKEECRLMNAPPIPPRSLKQAPSAAAALSKPRQQETRSPSPTLSYYSSGLHNIGTCEQGAAEPQDPLCYPCDWGKSACSSSSLPTDGAPSRLSWPNDLSGGADREVFVPAGARSYYSYPRKRSGPSGAKTCASSSLGDFEGGDSLNCHLAAKSCSYSADVHRDKPIEESDAKQSLSCPVLPPRTPRTSAQNQGERGAPDDSASPARAAPTLAPPPQWRPPPSLAGLSIEEVSRSLRFIGLPDDVAQLFVREKIDGSLLLQLTEEILAEDFRLSKLQVKKLIQFISGWRPKI